LSTRQYVRSYGILCSSNYQPGPPSRRILARGKETVRSVDGLVVDSERCGAVGPGQ
jgi:hypothetical protein